MAFGQSTPGTINVRLNTAAGAKQFDITDFGPYPLYSSAQIATTQATELVYFNYSTGQFVPGTSTTATALDTNMRSGNGQLDASGEMLVYAMRVELPPAVTIADAQALQAGVYSRLEISTEKPISEGPLSFYPAGGGLWFSGTATNINQVINGVPAASSGRVFASPHYIGAITNFRVTQLFPNGALALGTTAKLRIILDGLRRRASQ